MDRPSWYTAGNATGDLQELARHLLGRLDEVVLGKQAVTSQVLCTMLAGGHVLLEDIPGVGKTTLALAISKLVGLACTRIQLTPDVMPSDIVGFSLYRQDTGTFEYQPGAVFCNLLLADEINRTSPKTQSALLEVMEERRVTVDGVTRPVPSPFFVIATQNASGTAGTQALPPSQLDRFMACTSLGYPDSASELALARGDNGTRRTDGLEQVVGTETFLAMQQACQATHIADAVLEYAVQLVRATRDCASFQLGASPRATLALVRLSKAAAWLRGSTYVTPDDVFAQFPAATRHRVTLRADERGYGRSADAVLAEVAARIARPRLKRSSASDTADLGR